MVLRKHVNDKDNDECGLDGWWVEPGRIYHFNYSTQVSTCTFSRAVLSKLRVYLPTCKDLYNFTISHSLTFLKIFFFVLSSVIIFPVIPTLPLTWNYTIPYALINNTTIIITHPHPLHLSWGRFVLRQSWRSFGTTRRYND